jgi:hypothetical protein
MKVTYSSETSVSFQRITWLYIPENITFHKDGRENLKSCIDVLNPIDEPIPDLGLVHTLLTRDEKISLSADFKSRVIRSFYFLVLSMWIMKSYITEYCIILKYNTLENARDRHLPCSKIVCVKNPKFIVILTLK